MHQDRIDVPYNRNLKLLEDALGGVRRPGDFFVRGSLDTPLPRLEVNDVGLLSFPVPEAQLRQLIGQAGRAPYGRGQKTLIDESVRKVWQLSPDRVRIGGRGWKATFESILAIVQAGLGCADTKIGAEFYKLLVYDEGGFFKAHRDTEKVEHMFGTLVVVLPSAHRGGDLVVRHAGREVVLDLSSEEVSEVTFAAFYADCEHEVRPVTNGRRICLIYNLLQLADDSRKAVLPTAPLYDAETEAAAGILAEALGQRGAPGKLAWLLEHQYSPAGLSFAGLKGADAARGQVLSRAAARAGCALHLGLVHIEENGPAEPDYSDYGYRDRYGDYDEDGEVEEDAGSDEFTVIEVSDGSRHIDQWINERDQAADYGPLPLEDGEVLPAGALDSEAPDEQRLTEATGNEGASFERAYHRAALVIWPRDRWADVLLQAGVGAAVPYLRELLAGSTDSGGRTPSSHEMGVEVARRIVAAWKGPRKDAWFVVEARRPNRAEMLALLNRLGNVPLLERFVREVIGRDYDGSENEELAEVAKLLGPKRTGGSITEIVRRHMPRCPGACVDLLCRFIDAWGDNVPAIWAKELHEVGEMIVRSLSGVKPSAAAPPSRGEWGYGESLRLKLSELENDDGAAGGHPSDKRNLIDASVSARLLGSLGRLGKGALRAAAANAFIGNIAAFDPVVVIVPALTSLEAAGGDSFSGDAEAARLWAHAAEFLLGRSEHPPVPPKDWRQKVTLTCSCADCRELAAFAADPTGSEHRFRMRKDRRQHLHEQITRHGIDMTHVTERRGSPQTLVCTKTRGAYARQCEQHRTDCEAMCALLAVQQKMPGSGTQIGVRLAAAASRRPLLSQD